MNMIDLSTIRFTPADRRKLWDWLMIAEPTGFVGMVAKGVTPPPPVVHPTFKLVDVE